MQVILRVPFANNVVQLPRDDQGELTIFDGEPGRGWSILETTTGSETHVTVLVSASEAVIAELRTDETLEENVYPALPSSGWLTEGDIYTYNDGLVIVRQSHERTEWTPEYTPALFSVYRVDSGTVPDWVANEAVNVGDLRYYDALVYECIQAHTTQVDWYPTAPGILGVLWQEYSEEPPVDEWQIGIAYAVNDRVTYGGKLWNCDQAHTSISTWYPGAPGVYLWSEVVA